MSLKCGDYASSTASEMFSPASWMFFVELRGAPEDRCLIDLTLRCARGGKAMYAKLDNGRRPVSDGPVLVCLVRAQRI